MTRERFILSSSPHVRSEEDVPRIMYSVVIALAPAALASIYFFGFRALLLMITCVVAALAAEWVYQRIRGQETMVSDGSAAITGLLLAMVLPPSFPYGLAALGSVVAILIGKQVFGGLGYNIFNPALVGRAFLQAAFPVAITTWSAPNGVGMGLSPDAATAATPLALAKFEAQFASIGDLFLGKVSGCLGETSAVALIVGAIFLLVKRYIDWRIPLAYFGTVVVISGILWGVDPAVYGPPWFHLFAGGLMLGGLFMATDMVTTPITTQGRWIFGIVAGVLVALIRIWGGLPEGVMYSILLTNAFVPLLNRYIQPKRYGEERS